MLAKPGNKNAPACLNGSPAIKPVSQKGQRNSPRNKEYLRWVTDPLLLHDPLRPKTGACSVA
jgi:hypothetical protein